MSHSHEEKEEEGLGGVESTDIKDIKDIKDFKDIRYEDTRDIRDIRDIRDKKDRGRGGERSGAGLRGAADFFENLRFQLSDNYVVKKPERNQNNNSHSAWPIGAVLAQRRL